MDATGSERREGNKTFENLRNTKISKLSSFTKQELWSISSHKPAHASVVRLLYIESNLHISTVHLRTLVGKK